jgi:hypothetical protein
MKTQTAQNQTNDNLILKNETYYHTRQRYRNIT